MEEWKPRSRLEAAAWRTVQGGGVWRFERIDEKDGDVWMTRAVANGLDMNEALARCPPETADEREALVDLFGAIEAGRLDGERAREMYYEEEEGD